MKTHHPKLKATTRQLFSCGFFRHCTQTVLSPTSSNPPTLTLPHSDPTPPPSSDPPPPTTLQSESESSSSSNTSQSFTQWRFPLPQTPISTHLFPPPPQSDLPKDLQPETNQKCDPPPAPPVIATNLQELFHVAELQFSTGSDSDRLKAIHWLERSLVPNPPAILVGDVAACPAAVMRGVVGYLKEKIGAKPATKVLLALCLAEGNRHVAVEAGAVGKVVEALADMEGAAAERALAALELLCTLAEGAAEMRAHALAVPMMVELMGKMAGRGREYAISVLAVIFGGYRFGMVVAPPEEMARAVVLALQGGCTARGRRKGAQLLKILEENGGLDLTQEGW